MHIHIPRIEVTLDSDEVSVLAYALLRDLRRSVETHWCKLQRSAGSKLAAFEKDRCTRQQLDMMDKLFAAEGRYDLATESRKEFRQRLEQADRESEAA